jgi:3-deoxy-D-arabino-heptulosonate 7-phosphate (DAHP) synthase class II
MTNVINKSIDWTSICVFLVYVWIGDRFGEITVAHVDFAKVISNSNMHL